MPMKKLDKESETSATVVPRSWAMAGKPGRYMSMEKGPRAVSVPKIRMREMYFLRVIKRRFAQQRYNKSICKWRG